MWKKKKHLYSNTHSTYNFFSFLVCLDRYLIKVHCRSYDYPRANRLAIYCFYWPTFTCLHRHVCKTHLVCSATIGQIICAGWLGVISFSWISFCILVLFLVHLWNIHRLHLSLSLSFAVSASCHLHFLLFF